MPCLACRINFLRINRFFIHRLAWPLDLITRFAIAGSAVWSSHAVSVWRTSSHIRGMNYVLQLVWKSYLLNSYRRYESRWDENHTLLVWNSYRCFCCFSAAVLRQEQQPIKHKYAISFWNSRFTKSLLPSFPFLSGLGTSLLLSRVKNVVNWQWTNVIPLLQTKTADTAHTGIFASVTRPSPQFLGGAWGRG